ncbi:MAG: site-2 protease family protein [Gammaproteobacteria bacterium]|nr:MAG: site-2 protease family protein [Gammaproteobacteria bacterium]
MSGIAAFTLIQKITIWAVPVLLAITVHEVAHGFVAHRFGDRTAALQGRLTLNPVRHVDPIGTLLIPLILVLLHANFLFGWAKPVPVDPRNFRNPRRDMAVVALAGPLSNLLMAFFWALMIHLAAQLFGSGNAFGRPLLLMGVAGIFINAVLMALNLLPLPPLDGGRVLTGLLPARAAWRFARIEPYGIWILLALLVTGLLNALLWPLMHLAVAFTLPVSGMSAPTYWSILALLIR